MKILLFIAFFMLTFLLMPIFANAQVEVKDKIAPPISTSINGNPGETIKKNDTIAVNFNNDIGSDNIAGVASAFNLTNNTLFGDEQIKNLTSSRFNFTNATSGIAVGSSDAAALVGSELTADFNGDGFEDKAIGIPREDVFFQNGNREDAGIVQVIYGSQRGLDASDNAVIADQVWHQRMSPRAGHATSGFPRDGNFFGWSLSAGDYNGDSFADLAIGIMGQDFIIPVDPPEFILDAGMVGVIYGSPAGLSEERPGRSQLLFQGFGARDETSNSPLSRERSEAEDRFGSSLTSGDYNGDGRDDLAIGVPNEDHRQATGANQGLVHVIYGTPEGLIIFPDGRGDQAWKPVGTELEHDDFFGDSLSSGNYNGDEFDDLTVGITKEDIGTIRNAGAVNVIYGSGGGLSSNAVLPIQLLTQESSFIELDDQFGRPLSSGDYNNDSRDDLAVGTPGEDIRMAVDAGDVHIFYGSLAGLSDTTRQVWSQDSGIKDQVEDHPISSNGDFFGLSLSSGDFNGDRAYDLAIGAPFETIEEQNIPGAGVVHVIYGSSSGLSATTPIADQLWMQGSNSVFNGPSNSDLFGLSLSSGNYNGDEFDDLTVGVPNEGPADVGIIHLFDGSPLGLSPKTVFLDQIRAQGIMGLADEIEDDDLFGSVQ
jgi:FG-GAP repeat